MNGVKEYYGTLVFFLILVWSSLECLGSVHPTVYITLLKIACKSVNLHYRGWSQSIPFPKSRCIVGISTTISTKPSSDFCKVFGICVIAELKNISAYSINMIHRRFICRLIWPQLDSNEAQGSIGWREGGKAVNHMKAAWHVALLPSAFLLFQWWLSFAMLHLHLCPVSCILSLSLLAGVVFPHFLSIYSVLLWVTAVIFVLGERVVIRGSLQHLRMYPQHRRGGSIPPHHKNIEEIKFMSDHYYSASHVYFPVLNR